MAEDNSEQWYNIRLEYGEGDSDPRPAVVETGSRTFDADSVEERIAVDLFELLEAMGSICSAYEVLPLRVAAYFAELACSSVGKECEPEEAAFGKAARNLIASYGSPEDPA
jgi:hypothetical protein